MKWTCWRRFPSGWCFLPLGANGLDLNISLCENSPKSFKSNTARTQNMLVRTPAATRHSRSTESSPNNSNFFTTFSTRYLPNRGINAFRRNAKHAREHSSACTPRCCCLKKNLNACTSRPSELFLTFSVLTANPEIMFIPKRRNICIYTPR